MIPSRDQRLRYQAPSIIMVIPVQVTFRNMSTSEALEAVIRERAAKLDRFHPHIMACRVAVEAARHRHMRGSVFHVRFDVTVAHGEVVVTARLCVQRVERQPVGGDVEHPGDECDGREQCGSNSDGSSKPS